MAPKALTSAVRQLRTVARRPAASDHALLTRFVQADDEDAFRDLVRRHERTVLTACRQVLTDPADVDDAFQATFLVLLKKARTVDATMPLAGWLFAVAHRVAVRARADSRRRATREAEAAQRKTTTVELPDLTWREAAAVLHDELNALPDKYRLPLLLCCVEGVTRDEAAEQLRTTVGAIRGQLERGRSLLERRMTRRGIALSAGWLAVLLGSSRAAAVPPADLIELTLRAASGATHPAVAALARGAFPMTLLKRATVAALLLAGLLGVGIGVAGPRPESKADDKPPVGKAAEEPPKERTITGKVLGADGKPVVADLYLAWVEGKTESLGKTKEDGTFSVTVKLIDPGAHLIAQAPGHGIEFMMPARNTPTELTFKLPKDNPIKGRVLDTQGKPVIGATVAVTRLQTYDKEPAERYLTAWMKEGRERGLPLPDGDRILWLRERLQNRQGDLLLTTTDKDGKFTLTGVGQERLAGLAITGPGVADRWIGVFNRPGFDPTPYNQDQRDRESMRFTFVRMTNQLMSAEPAVFVEQEKVLRGRVTDPEGKPRGGVKVVFSRPTKWDLNPDHNTAVTDKDGRYEIRGARKHPGYMVEVEGDPQAGLLPCQAFADDTVGYEPVTLDLKCARGLVVTGTIKDKATGKPVPNASVYVAVLAKNPHVKDYPPFLHSASSMATQNLAKDGRFRLVTIPGPVLLQVAPRDDSPGRNYKPVKADPAHPDYFHKQLGHLGYYGLDSSYGIVQGNWCKVLVGKKGDREITVDVELEEGSAHSIRVVDADGKPVAGAAATGLSHVDFDHPKTIVADKLTVYNVEPGTPRLIAVAHRGRRLVGTATMKANDKDPEVKLGAGGVVTGRVVDADGKPLAGVDVQLYYARREVMEVAKALTGQGIRGVWAEGMTTTTGADGTFRYETVFPASEFRLAFSKGKKRFDPDYDKAAKHTVARHGDTLKVGDVVVTPKAP